MPHLFCIGLGYSALALARRLMERGWKISGTCRSEDTGRRLQTDTGIVTRVASREHPPADPGRDLGGVTHLLSSVPPDDMGDAALDIYGAAMARHPGLHWVGYLSTTGVYGDRGGGWVDEDAALEPTGDRGDRRVAAERAWMNLHERYRTPVHLFRLAGIYGPGRSALDTARSGRAQRIIKPGQVFSRTHVEDIATILEASIKRPSPGRAYNVCDDDPAPPDEVIAYACALLGVPAPEPVAFEDARLSPMGRSFYADNKRVSNARIKQELGVNLRYPTYKDGLSALLASGF